jgi:aminoglycoside phosphotransferase (APT) family kinase protein
VRRDPDAAIGLGLRFVAELPEVVPAAANAGWYDELVAGPLERMAAAAPLGGELPDLVARTHALLGPLRATAVPAVLEHGDLSHPNLFVVDGADGLGVVDWEHALQHGMPGQDLVFLLLYLGEARVGAETDEARRAAFDATFTGPDAWAPAHVRGHLRLRGIPEALWGQVVLAACARMTTTVHRLLRSAADELGAAVDIAGAVAASRELDLWRHALAAAESGRLPVESVPR